jgi:transcriptional regulator with XRE-family HTH domain
MDEFAAVLRAWRDRMRPEEAGLPAGPGRRAPGLRREELAALAGVSVEYIVRLEQGRAQHPSPQLLGALARALRLSDDERDHLHRVGGAAVPTAAIVPRHIPPGVQRLMDRLGDVPMAVMSASWDLLQWNPLWSALTGDPSELRGPERNVAWRHFVTGPGVIDFDAQHAEEFSSDLTADLREATGRYPEDRTLTALIARLRTASPDFDRRWGGGARGPAPIEQEDGHGDARRPDHRRLRRAHGAGQRPADRRLHGRAGVGGRIEARPAARRRPAAARLIDARLQPPNQHRPGRPFRLSRCPAARSRSPTMLTCAIVAMRDPPWPTFGSTPGVASPARSRG